MRILGIGDHHSLGDMYARLAQDGHEVRVYVSEPESHSIYAGINHRVDSFEPSLAWVREAGRDGLILFETASRGALQEDLRRQGFFVIGGCAWGDRLENDRAFGQQVLRDAGLRTAPIYHFTSTRDARDFVERNPRRYVFKVNGSEASSTRTYVGLLEDGSDLVAVLDVEHARLREGIDPFVLMAHVKGVEVGVGAYFNGVAFTGPVCLDWEHKHLFPGELGEMTGEMGTVVTYTHSQRLFAETLGKCAEQLRAAAYCGYINLNTIVNEDGVWPLEFTCRFGYPGFAICDALHLDSWAQLFAAMLGQREAAFRVRSGFAVGVVLTVPPFPYEMGYERLSKGLAVRIRGEATEHDRRHLHLGEVELTGEQLRMTGSIGYVCTVTGVGRSVGTAQQDAYRRANLVVVPTLRYRNDIGDRVRRGDLKQLQRLGWLPKPAPRVTRA